MRTCDKCGCYIPDGWEVCPACGLMTADSGGSGAAGVLLPGGWVNEYRGVVYAAPEEKPELQYAFELLNRIKPFDGNAHVEECSRKIESFEIVDVNTADGRTTHFPVPKPRGSIRKQMEDIAAGMQAIMRSREATETELRLIGMGYEKELAAMPPMDQTIAERLTAGFRR